MTPEPTVAADHDRAGLPATDGGPATPPATFGYQPGLDGLRALAIVSVMAFHGTFSDSRLRWWGGWLGIDLFFVLSGFLITRLLLDEHRRRARVDLRAFYVRRVLRLYPLIVAVLVATLVAMLLLPTGSQWRPRPLGIAAIAFYFVNWMNIHDRSGHTMGVWSHLWTLSIEEQFYLVWPACVVVLLRLRSRRAALASIVVLAAAGATAVALYRAHIEHAATYWNIHNPYAFGLISQHRLQEWDHWYFGSFTHTDGLLVGAILAVVLPAGWRVASRGARTALTVVGAAALVLDTVLIWSAGARFQPRWVAYTGLPTFIASTAVLVASVMLVPRSLLGRFLALRPLVWVGRRSYGLYVIHPPMYVLVQDALHHKGGWPLALAMAATFAAAALSFRFLERPALELKRRFARV